jgi:hypothetical protein
MVLLFLRKETFALGSSQVGFYVTCSYQCAGNFMTKFVCFLLLTHPSKGDGSLFDLLYDFQFWDLGWSDDKFGAQGQDIYSLERERIFLQLANWVLRREEAPL